MRAAENRRGHPRMPVQEGHALVLDIRSHWLATPAALGGCWTGLLLCLRHPRQARLVPPVDLCAANEPRASNESPGFVRFSTWGAGPFTAQPSIAPVTFKQERHVDFISHVTSVRAPVDAANLDEIVCQNAVQELVQVPRLG